MERSLHALHCTALPSPTKKKIAEAETEIMDDPTDDGTWIETEEGAKEKEGI